MVGLINLPGYQPSPLMDFGQINQALQMRAQQQAKADQMAMQERQQAEQARQFNAGHQLAQRSAARADAREPLELQSIQQSLADMKRRGAQDAEMYPFLKREKELSARLMEAKASGKDAESLMMADIRRQMNGGADPQAQPPQQVAPPPAAMPTNPNVRPQSNVMPPQAMQPTPVADTGAQPDGDPNLILAQAQGQPQPQAAPAQPRPGAGNVFGNMTDAEKLQFGLAYTGKGDAAKVIGEAAQAQKLGKEARNEVDKKEMGAIESLARAKDIARSYKPEYLTWEGKAKNYAISWADSFDATRKKLPPEVQQQHGDYIEFRRNAVSSMNQYIKDMTGAAMSELEANRLRQAMADAQADSPIAFERKLKATAREAEMTVARMRMLRRDGFQGQPWSGDANRAASALPLPQFQRMIESDTRRMYQELKTQNPQSDDAQIKGQVRQSIRAKYGIDA